MPEEGSSASVISDAHSDAESNVSISTSEALSTIHENSKESQPLAPTLEESQPLDPVLEVALRSASSAALRRAGEEEESQNQGPLCVSAKYLPLRHLPVAFVVFLMVTLYFIYVFMHCKWMVQSEGRETRGYVEAAVFHLLTLMMLVSFVASILTPPGTIPDDDEWIHHAPASDEEEGRPGPCPPSAKERKGTGERRVCKWCVKYKPDRCHHCRTCQSCVLKMDHHCPWICNCVGFGNHKYFFLLVMYGGVDCHFITWTMLESVRRAIEVEDMEFPKMFLLLFGITLSCFWAVVLTFFLVFHVWLIAKAMTTIEFCEQKVKVGSFSSAWDNGLCQNVRAVLGPNALLWLLPLSPPEGDGLMSHCPDRAELIKHIEAGMQSPRRKGHKAVQRQPLLWEASADNVSPRQATCSLTGVLSRAASRQPMTGAPTWGRTPSDGARPVLVPAMGRD